MYDFFFLAQRKLLIITENLVSNANNIGRSNKFHSVGLKSGWLITVGHIDNITKSNLSYSLYIYLDIWATSTLRLNYRLIISLHFGKLDHFDLNIKVYVRVIEKRKGETKLRMGRLWLRWASEGCLKIEIGSINTWNYTWKWKNNRHTEKIIHEIHTLFHSYDSNLSICDCLLITNTVDLTHYMCMCWHTDDKCVHRRTIKHGISKKWK